MAGSSLSFRVQGQPPKEADLRSNVPFRARLASPCGAHHVEGARREAEHQEDDQTPGGGPEPAVEDPAEAAARDDPGHEFRRHAEGAAERGGTGGRFLETPLPSRRGIPLPVELGFELSEPRGEIAVGGCPRTRLALVPCIVAIHGATSVTRARAGCGRPPKP